MPRSARWKTPLKLMRANGQDTVRRHLRDHPNDFPAAIEREIRENAANCDLLLGWFSVRGIVSDLAYELAREENPELIIVEYGNATNWASDTVRFNGGRPAEEMFSWARRPGVLAPLEFAGREEWLVHWPDVGGGSSQRMYRSKGQEGNICYYVGHPEYQRMKAESVVRVIESGANGVWWDNHDLELNQYFPLSLLPREVRRVPKDPETGRDFTQGAWARQYREFARVCMDVVKGRFGDPPRHHGRRVFMYANNGSRLSDLDELDSVVGVYGGGSTESPGVFIPRIGMIGRLPVYPVPDFREQVLDGLRVVVERKLHWVYRSKRLDLGRADAWPTTGDGFSRHLFMYGSCLLVGGRPGDGGLYMSPEIAGAAAHPMFEVDLGEALDERPEEDSGGEVGVWRRRFRRGTVFVNASGAVATVDPRVVGTWRRVLDESMSEDSPGENRVHFRGLSSPQSGALVVPPFSAAIFTHADRPVEDGGGGVATRPLPPSGLRVE